MAKKRSQAECTTFTAATATTLSVHQDPINLQTRPCGSWGYSQPQHKCKAYSKECYNCSRKDTSPASVRSYTSNAGMTTTMKTTIPPTKAEYDPVAIPAGLVAPHLTAEAVKATAKGAGETTTPWIPDVAQVGLQATTEEDAPPYKRSNNQDSVSISIRSHNTYTDPIHRYHIFQQIRDHRHPRIRYSTDTLSTWWTQCILYNNPPWQLIKAKWIESQCRCRSTGNIISPQ